MNRSIINYFTETEKNNSLTNTQNKALLGFSLKNLNPLKSPVNPKAPNIPKPKLDSNNKPLTSDSFKK